MDVKALSRDQPISDSFAVLQIQQRTTRTNKPFLIVKLSHPTGRVSAKVWSEAMSRAELEEGKVYHIEGQTEEYQGQLAIVIDRAEPVENQPPEGFQTKLNTLIFDIETTGPDFEELDDWGQAYLLQLEKDQDPEEAKKRSALQPLFGSVVTIGTLDPDQDTGTVLGVMSLKITPRDSRFSYTGFKDEAALLKAFWEQVTGYDHLVTYNGESFDFPYLLFRSGVNRIPVSLDITDLRRFRDRHIDLAWKVRPVRHKYKLEAVCRAFGIRNPKEDGISGLMVPQLFKKKKYQQIVDYVTRDVTSTTELYRHWRRYLNPVTNKVTTLGR